MEELLEREGEQRPHRARRPRGGVLVVAGGKPKRAALAGAAALTPPERRMAEHVARGLSNREIAETLFVTRKTVEFTLGNAYSKLGIRSRTQLAVALSV